MKIIDFCYIVASDCKLFIVYVIAMLVNKTFIILSYLINGRITCELYS